MSSVTSQKMVANVEPPYCKPCLESGHYCTATRRMENEDWCQPCVMGIDCQKKEVAPLPKELAVAVAQVSQSVVLKPFPEARDLTGILSKVIAGILDGTIEPGQANAVAGTANVLLKAMKMAKER